MGAAKGGRSGQSGSATIHGMVRPSIPRALGAELALALGGILTMLMMCCPLCMHQRLDRRPGQLDGSCSMHGSLTSQMRSMRSGGSATMHIADVQPIIPVR